MLCLVSYRINSIGKALKVDGSCADAFLRGHESVGKMATRGKIQPMQGKESVRKEKATRREGSGGEGKRREGKAREEKERGRLARREGKEQK